VLLYGGVIYACMSNVDTILEPTNVLFSKAEVFVRRMLRWAF
jgi:hypothetical protein